MYFPQGGRYIQVPWYIPVQPQLYPNYQVDPNHPQWIPAPQYGNAPILNGRQSETDGSEHDSSVDDERSGASSFPPPGVGLPATSMQQQVYQVMPPFSNMYAGMNMQGFVNSPIPYPHPYPGIATSGELNTPPNSNRGNRGGGKSNSGGKLSNEKGSGVNDSSFNSQAPLTSQESNSTNDPSTPTLPPALAGPPPHPPTNFMPLGPMQYSYPYFHQAGPPPPHITSAQHATGSPLYIPHSVPIYPPMYNSAPAAVYSTDNGMPHSAVSAASVSMPPPTEIIANHEAETTNFGTEENSVDEGYKTSNLRIDSPPFEQQGTLKNGNSFSQGNVSTSSDIASDNNHSLPNNSDQSIPSEVPCSTDKEESVTDDNYHANDSSLSSSETASCLEQPINFGEKYPKVENLTNSMSSISIKDENKKLPSDKEASNSFSKNGVVIMNYKNGMTIPTNIDISNIINSQKMDASANEANEKCNDTESNESKTGSIENINGKSNTSQDSISSVFEAPVKTSGADAKSESIEEPAPAQGMKTWASLFKESSSSFRSRPSPSIAPKTSSEMCNNAAVYLNQNADGHSAAASTNSSSINGMHTMQSQSKAPVYNKYSPMLSSTLADDTTLPKIGERLKAYNLDHKAVNFEPRGLENRSNCCYVNAILQALLACPPFYNLMKFISTNLHNSKAKMASKQHFPIIDSMVQFIDEFKLISQKSRISREKARKMDALLHQEIIPGKPFEPSSMLSMIQGNSLFTVGQQEDAQEFLTCLLNGLNDEMVELIQLAEGNHVNSCKTPQSVTKTPLSKNNKKITNGDIASEVHAPDDSDSEWKQVHSKAKSNRPNNLALTQTPLSKIFRGQTRSRLQKFGDQTTNNIEPFFTLHLNIEKVASVKEALESLFMGQSPLEGVTSSRTNQEVDAWQQQTLEELPLVLLLHLKYFDYKHHTCTKILKSTEFPIDLKLDLKLITNLLRAKNTNTKSRQYKLFAVVYHDGKEATKGHYVTDVFHIGYGGWIRYDDAKVITVSENDVLKPQLPRVPYLLYYRRCDTIAALMQPPFEKRM